MIKFNEKYDSGNFLQFLQDFLPSDFVEKEEDVVINKDRYKEITKAKILGYCESLDLYILEMEHSREKDPRVTIATDAFKILADHWIHKALVIFENKDSDNYRFSYLTISLDLNEKNKAVKKYSNARRYSFYLGVNAKVRTPEQQLIKKGRLQNIEDLFNRFSVEVVNKQFYLEVARFFDELVSGLSLPSVSQENINIKKTFAVRLIGRLMFCWFLKQKKSASGQLIPDEILSSKVVSNNYYHGIIEPLFFEVLNTSIETRGIRNDLFDKVPYLNGGLFNPQSEDYYELDRGTFTSKFINTLKISDDWFKNFFELLETYNFTIDENTVFDQELSVDPEMLGRIFENLLAEIDHKEGSSEQKRTGSFYTPRQIVEYMVDQSLIEYLKTKTGIESEKLSALLSYDLNDDEDYPLNDIEKQEIVEAIGSLKILDPACGSGAYPIGALQKIVYALQLVDPDCKLWLDLKLKGVPDLYKQKIINEVQENPFDYVRKLDVIKYSIFGVDIQPIAVDVSRLRCFLTLVVESEIDDAKSNRGIEPLPNLDFKFVCANTLIGLPKVEKTGLFDDHSGIAELSNIMSEYFSCNSQGKNEIKLKFANSQKMILEKTISAFRGSTGDLTLKLVSWNPFSNNCNPWFDPEWMFGTEEKFDIVIGNPPYIKEYTNRGAFDGVRESDYYQGKMDIWYMFACMGFDFLKENGVECFIAQNNWVTSSGASKMRNKIIRDNQIVSILDFGNYKIFETAGIQTMVMLFKKSSSLDNYQIDYRRLKGEDLVIGDALDLLMKKTNPNAEYLTPEISRKELFDKKITFSDSVSDKILKKIVKNSNFKLTEKEVANGIHHHHDRINKDRKNILNGRYKVGDGIFVLSNQEKDKICFTQKELELIKPSYTTKELIKWYGNPHNKEWVIYTDSSFRNEDKINEYPNIKKHLDQFKEVITSDNKPYGLHRSREEYFFKGEKIIAVRKCLTPTFTYTDFDCYVSATFYVIKTERLNQKYLTGLLNSSLIKFWLRNKGKMQGNNFQIDKDPIMDLPLSIATKEKQYEISNLVDNILALKRNDRNADIKSFESQIDKLVYEIYGLTEDDIKIVEAS
ncbi:MAG: N-6 DNA methylase [Patescibacteria group bacterium]|nr:N-6 DNA methylase [Patescibacteria group bacterium]